MARKKISEFRAKTLLTTALSLPYEGVSFDTALDSFKDLNQLDSNKTYVVKVDEGVKKRMKQGLLALNKKPQELKSEIKKLQEKGYSHFIIEPFLKHDGASEKYLSIEQVREGIRVLYSDKGGIDIEENQEHIQQAVISSKEDAQAFMKKIGTDNAFELKIKTIKEAFVKYHFSFIEINPLIITDGKWTLLDLAAEVDSTGEFFVKGAWTEKDFRSGKAQDRTEEEKNVSQLAAKSQAAFSLEVLNPDGSIFMLLSGGGASIVLADEVADQGYGKELANYGEYSGNPNAEETYLYAKNILSLMLKSRQKKKVLIIAGGVANFTDVRITFNGLIKALEEVKNQLKEQKIKIFVRRGGPFQEEGLAQMKSFLEKEGLLGMVQGPELILTDIISQSLKSIA